MHLEKADSSIEFTKEGIIPISRFILDQTRVLIVLFVFMLFIIRNLSSKNSILFSLHEIMKILSSFSHSPKTYSPIDAIEEGIEICVNDEHPLKASLPIEVTEERIVICVNCEHPLNA